MTNERQEKNRRLSEWLEPNPVRLTKYDAVGFPIITFVSESRCWFIEGPGNTGWQPVDFFADESANAMLLEAMPAVELYKHPPDGECDEGGWRCRPDWGLDAAIYHADRKTCVAEAYLAWKQSEAK